MLPTITQPRYVLSLSPMERRNVRLLSVNLRDRLGINALLGADISM